jgi:hypothetical protein
MKRSTSYGEFYGYKPTSIKLKELNFDYNSYQTQRDMVSNANKKNTSTPRLDFMKHNINNVNTYVEKLKLKKKLAEEMK